MAVGAALTQAGFIANDLNTEAILDLDMDALAITGIHLDLKGARIDGVSEEMFKQIAEGAEKRLYHFKSIECTYYFKCTI